MSGAPSTAQLDLASKWARELQLGVEQVVVLGPDRAPLPAVGILRNQLRLVLLDLNGTLHLVCDLGFPPDFRAAVGRLSSKLQEEMLIAMRQALSEIPRIGWTFMPPGSQLRDLENLRLECAFRINATDVQSFNRFADALQETSTATVKVAAVFGQLMVSPFQSRVIEKGGRSNPPGYG